MYMLYDNSRIRDGYGVKISNVDRLILYWVINVFCLLALVIFFQNTGILLIGMIGIAVFSLAAQGIERCDWKKFTIYTFVAFLFMLVVYSGLIERYGEPFYGGDDKMFEENGRSLYYSGLFRFKDVPYIQGMTYAKGYLTIIAWIYRASAVFGDYSTISPRVLNIYLWMATVVLIYKQIKERNISETILQKGLPILALYPNALFISSCVYRDTMVTFFLVLGIISFEKIINAFRNNKMIWSGNFILYAFCFVLGAYMLKNLRPQMVYIFVVICVLYFTWGRLQLSIWKKILLFACAGLIAFLVFNYSGGMKLLNLIMDSYYDYRISVNDGMASRIFSMSLIPFGFIARLIYGLFCPFPGGIISLLYYQEPIFSFIMLLIYMGTIFQIYFIPYIVRSITKMDYGIMRFLIVYGAIIITTFTFRHFIMIYPFAMSAVCGQIDDVPTEKRRRWRIIMTFMIVIAAMTYLILKMI